MWKSKVLEILTNEYILKYRGKFGVEKIPVKIKAYLVVSDKQFKYMERAIKVILKPFTDV